MGEEAQARMAQRSLAEELRGLAPIAASAWGIAVQLPWALKLQP